MTLLVVCLAWLLGGVLGAAGYGDAWAVVLLAGGIACAVLVVCDRRGQALVLGMSLLAGLVSNARFEADGPEPMFLALRDEMAVVGVVVLEPESRGATQNFRVHIEEVSESGLNETEALEGRALRVTQRLHPKFERGDVIELRGVLEPLAEIESEGFRAYLERQGVAGTMLFPEVDVVGHRDGTWLGEALASVRRDLASALEGAMPEPEAALAKGMLLGQRDGIPDEVEDEFNEAGISHLIVISGANVMLVAGFVVGVLRGAIGRRQATVAAMLVVVVYAVFVGGSPPVWRATAMAIVVLGAVLAGRGDFSRGVASPLRSYGLNALLLAAVGMTVLEPRVIEDVSFQLSFGATLGIVLFAGRLEEAIDATMKLVPEVVARLLAGQLAMTTAASIAVIPIIAVYFGRLSLVAVPANLVATPVFVLALGGSALTAVAGSLDGDFGVAVGAVGHLPMAFLVWLADFASALPLASVRVQFSWWGALAAYALLGAGLVRTLGRRPRVDEEEASPRRFRLQFAGVAALAVAGAAVVTWWGTLTPDSGRLRVTVLDVGQGDAILIETPEGHRVLVDGGPSGAALMQALGEALPASEREIELVVLTHAQDDHVTGLVELLSRYEVSRVFEGPLEGETEAYRAWGEAVKAEGAVRHRASAGQVVEVGAVRIEVIAPTSVIAGGDPNENSVVLRVVYGEVSFLLTGDLGEKGEASLLDAGFDLRSTVLKVGHHGSDGATTRPFLDAVSPAVAVVSAGEGNVFGHPAPGLRLRLGDVPLFRTDLNASVRFETDGERVWVVPERGSFSSGVAALGR